jgi:hypothetical protein
MTSGVKVGLSTEATAYGVCFSAEMEGVRSGRYCAVNVSICLSFHILIQCMLPLL